MLKWHILIGSFIIISTFFYNEKSHHFHVSCFPNDLATLCTFLLVLMEAWPITPSALLGKYKDRNGPGEKIDLDFLCLWCYIINSGWWWVGGEWEVRESQAGRIRKQRKGDRCWCNTVTMLKIPFLPFLLTSNGSLISMYCACVCLYGYVYVSEWERHEGDMWGRMCSRIFLL